MNRRDFMVKSASAGVALSLTSGIIGKLGASALSASPFDLVAIKGGEPGDMFDKAMSVMGGMERFVKRGQTVVVKPNIGWDSTPDRAADTNPQLVSRIIEHCFNAGAKDVYVFDNTCDNWTKCYSSSGIEKAAKEAGAKVVGGNTENYYQTVSVNGTFLKTAKVHELILSSDVFINVPVLKHHSSTRVTVSMKNLMGVVWDRGFWHRNNLHQCIADFAAYKKPHLNIVDAYAVIKRNGPRGVSKEDILPLKSQIISTDMVAADAAAAMIFGSQPSDIPYIGMANEMKVGMMDLNKLNIKRIKVG